MQSCLIVVNSWRTNTEGVTVWVGEGQTGWVSPGITGTAILSILLEGCGTSFYAWRPKRHLQSIKVPSRARDAPRGLGTKHPRQIPRERSSSKSTATGQNNPFFFFSCSSRQAVTVTFIWDTISLEFLPTVSGQGDWEEQGEALISP